jgi:hypothetical protein
MLLRLSRKLAKKLHETGLNSATPEKDPYADWYARVFSFDRVRYIVALNTSSLLATILWEKR